jgi:hypothetical protein
MSRSCLKISENAIPAGEMEAEIDSAMAAISARPIADCLIESLQAL